MKTLPMQFSYFTHSWEKRSTEIELKHFIDDVRSERWTVLARSYRCSLSKGMDKEAAQ
ncbi:MAG: hypothetical protein RSH25_16130 [Bacteroides sp.]|uniref:hypothetical protein n=1 Tax=Bacteroides sp. TaxID=29523 RepID=UPI002FC81D69